MTIQIFLQNEKIYICNEMANILVKSLVNEKSNKKNTMTSTKAVSGYFFKGKPNKRLNILKAYKIYHKIDWKKSINVHSLNFFWNYVILCNSEKQTKFWLWQEILPKLSIFDQTSCNIWIVNSFFFYINLFTNWKNTN